MKKWKRILLIAAAIPVTLATHLILLVLLLRVFSANAEPVSPAFTCSDTVMTAQEGHVYDWYGDVTEWRMYGSAPESNRLLGYASGDIDGDALTEETPVYLVYKNDSEHLMLHAGYTSGTLSPQHDYFRIDYEYPELSPDVVDAAGVYAGGMLLKKDIISFESSIVERIFEIMQREPLDSIELYEGHGLVEYLETIYLYEYDYGVPMYQVCEFRSADETPYMVINGKAYRTSKDEMEQIMMEIEKTGKKVLYPSQLKKP